MTSEASEAAHRNAIGDIAQKYRERGYDVVVEPKGSQLPPFLQGYEPDVIARRPGESIVVEVKVGTKASVSGRYRDVAARIHAEPGWRFDLVVVTSGGEQLVPDATLPDERTLGNRVAEARALEASGQLDAAFLLLWLTAEGALRLAAVRAMLPLEKMPPSALIRELYSSGELERGDYETVLALMDTRNRLVHGFSARATASELSALRSVVERLIAELPKSA